MNDVNHEKREKKAREASDSSGCGKGTHQKTNSYKLAKQLKAMKRIIQFKVYRREKYYVAECMDLPIVTQGRTLDGVVENIREAVEFHLEGEDLEELEISPHFLVLVNLELE